MASSVNSTSSSGSLRLSGMISGMDTDALVKQMMAGERAKIEKYNAKIQIGEWKTDAYREITSSLQSFYNTYFDPLSSSNMKSVNSFSSFATSYGETTSTNYVTVTGRADAKAGTYSIKALTTASGATLSGSDVSKAIEGVAIDTGLLGTNITSANNTLSITLNGTTKQVSLDTDGSVTTVAGLKTKLQEKIDAAFGAGKISVDLNTTSDGIKFSTERNTDTFRIGASGTANTVLGLTNSNLSNKLDLTANISDLKNSFSTPLSTSGAENDIGFTINGTSFSFSSNSTSIQDIMDEVNLNTTINATMKYDTTTNSFSIKSKSTGVTDEIVVADTMGSGNLMSVLGITGTDKGSDASVTLSDGTVIVRSSNTFVYDGLSFNIKQDFTSDTDSTTSTPDAIKVTISTDTTKSYEYIKGFVDKYNTILESLNSKLSEKKYRDYAPLTADQKTSMTEDQIKQWETKAKSGLLKNDSILFGVLSKFRNALYDTVEGAGINLSSIGITTTSEYKTKGKLEINETKLKEALATKSEQITKLFTSNSDKTYYQSLNSSTDRSERYMESGIAQRFSDVIQDAIRVSTDSNGNKGTLLNIAGISGDRSEFTNTLFKEMESFNSTVTELNNKLSDRETALYAKFTAMETALDKMNSQQSYITQMLG